MVLIPVDGKTPRVAAATDHVPLSPDGYSRADDIAGLNAPLATLLGSLTVLGHSYSVGTTQSDSGVSNAYQETVISKVMGLLGIHENNVLHLGTAGSSISQAQNLFVNHPLTGWCAALQFILPNNSNNINSASDVVISDPVTAVNGAGIIVHGVNDFILGATGVTAADDAQSAANNLIAGAHAYRAVLSRMRSGVVFGCTVLAGTVTADSPFAFTSSSYVQSVTQNSGPAYRLFTTNGGTFTFTIPTNYTGGVIAVNLIGQQQGVTHLTGAVAASGAVTVNVAANTQFPASGTLVIKIGNEEMIVTAGLGSNAWTVTSGNRGANGTAAAAHSTNDVVMIAPDTYKVTWSTSGSNAGITGTTFVGGQGSVNSPIVICKRFVCTAADAGKTIVGTIGGLIAADTSGKVIMDTVQFEDATPPAVVLTNLHHWNFAEFPWSSQISSTYVAAWNAAIAAVVAEFDSWVKIADVYTPFFKRNGVITGAMNATDVSTAIGFTANDASFTPTVGMRFSFGPSVAGSAAAEHCDCTAVSGSAPNWTLTLTRGSGGTTKVVHSSGAFLGPLQWMHTDNLHLSNEGHAVYAQAILDAFAATPKPASHQVAASQGNWSPLTQSIAMGIVDSNWMFPPCNNFGAAAVTNGLQFAFPTYIPKTCILTGMAVAVTTGATGLFRFGIYMPDYTHSRPGRLLQDFGAYTLAGTAPYSANQTGFYQILRPGWYWLSCAQQTTAVTLLTFGAGGMSTPVLSRTTPPNSSSGQLVGYYQTGIAGAFADWTTYNEMVGSASSATSGMCIYAQLRSTPLA